MLQVMKIPAAKVAVDKECEKLDKIPAWQMTKVRNKKEVIAEARNEGRTVHFASLMDVCHLENLELEPNFQKYKDRVVLRGDNVKDDSGSYAVFTEQGSSACKSNGCHTKTNRMRRASSRCNIGLHPGKNGRCSTITENSQIGMSRHLDTSPKPQMAKIMVQHGRPSRSS